MLEAEDAVEKGTKGVLESIKGAAKSVSGGVQGQGLGALVCSCVGKQSTLSFVAIAGHSRP